MRERTMNIAAALILALASPAAAQEAPAWSLAIHGGAGVIERANLSPQQDAAYRAALTRALETGAEVLRNGGAALDAVQAAIEVMEDDPLFNAGRGAVFTAEGRNEMDAAVMDGADLNAGSVAGLTRTRHPIAAARAVMERSPHVMLSGDGADAFSASIGLEQVDPAWFFVENRWRALERTLQQRGEPIPARPAGAPAAGEMAQAAPPLDERKYGTVGAVALDSQGRLAAGTSTGGTTGKRWGRIGDAPLIGAGTYASNAEGCAVSATGTGEYFIRATVARDICALKGRFEDTYQKDEQDAVAAQPACPEDSICLGHIPRPIVSAVLAEIDEVGRLGGDGGVIVMDETGAPWTHMNTSGMYRATITANRPAWVAIYEDEGR